VREGRLALEDATNIFGFSQKEILALLEG
jgi:hypothetical protein